MHPVMGDPSSERPQLNGNSGTAMTVHRGTRHYLHEIGGEHIIDLQTNQLETEIYGV